MKCTFFFVKRYLQAVLVYAINKKDWHFFFTSLDGVIELGIPNDTTSSEMYMRLVHISVLVYETRKLLCI